jgi:hypothetical protein
MIDNIIPHPSTTLAGAMSQLARSDSGSFRIADDTTGTRDLTFSPVWMSALA